MPEFEDGSVPTPEQAALLLEEALNGDTAPAETEPVVPDDEPEKDTAETTEDKPDVDDVPANADLPEAELNAENAVVLAKDGIHTIPYEKLVAARQDSANYKALYEKAMKDAQAQQAQPAPAPQSEKAATVQTMIDDGIDPELFGDFSEEAMVKGIQAVVDKRVAAALAPMQQQQQEIQSHQAQAAEEAHWVALYTAVPDLDSILESQEFDNWRTTQPSFVQAAYNTVLSEGTSKEVIDLMNLYKAQTAPVQAPKAETGKTSDQIRAAAREAVNKAQVEAPKSLSDLPTGNTQPVNKEDKLDEMTPVQLSEAMLNWTPEQIEKYLNRNS